MGFEEIDRSSDSAVLVKARTLEELFFQAGLAMYAIMDAQILAETCQGELKLAAPDVESLLVSFLSELLIVAELENLAMCSSRLEISQASLHGTLSFAPLSSWRENIKAVTFSEMQIRYSGDEYETVIVFDL